MSPPMTEQEPLQEVEQITPQQLEIKLKNVLEEYLKDCCFAKWDKDIRESIPASLLSQLLSLGYDKIVEESKRARIRTATLFAQFIRMNMLPLESYCGGLEEILEQVDDLTVDSPKIWEYLAEMVAPLIYENTLPLETLHASCEVLISQGNAGNFLGPIFKLVVSKMGRNYLAMLWHSSELIFEDFLPNDDVNKFIKDNHLEFLVDGVNADSETALTFEEIHQKLLDFFENENSFDDVSNWITVNVRDRVKDKQFSRVLATAVFENSIVGLKLDDEILRSHYKILSKYIDGNLEHEVQLLSALHAHINKLDNPEGVFLKVFLILHKDSMLSSDSIAHWASNKDPADEKEIDQSSPCNTTGKKVYDKEFLLALRNDPKSKKKPDNLPKVVLRKDQGQIGDVITDDVPTSSKSNYLDQFSPSKTTASKVYNKDFLLALRNHPKSKKKPDNLPEVVMRKDQGQLQDIILGDDVFKFSKSNCDQQSPADITGKKVQKTKSKKISDVIVVKSVPVKGSATQSFDTTRGPPPQNQTPRMGNHRQLPGQQQVFQPESAAPYMQVQPVQPMYCMPSYGSTQRPMVQQFSQGQYTTAVPYPQAPPPAQGYPYLMPKPQAPVGVARQTLAQPQPPPAIAANINQNPELQASQKKRRAKVIPITDPDTGKDKLSTVYDDIESHPLSGKSSARQTPQSMYIPNKEVQNAFTKQVNLILSKDKALQQPTGRQNTGVPASRLPSFFMNRKAREESSSSEDY